MKLSNEPLWSNVFDSSVNRLYREGLKRHFCRPVVRSVCKGVLDREMRVEKLEQDVEKSVL